VQKRQLNRFFASGGFRYHVQVCVLLKQSADAHPNHFMIVGNQDAN
jgi:hypothetical protein